MHHTLHLTCTSYPQITLSKAPCKPDLHHLTRHLARSWRRSSLRLGLSMYDACKTSRSYFRSSSFRSCNDRDPDFGPLSVVPARIRPRQVFDIIADISCLIFKGPISVSIASFRVGRFEIRGQVARSKIQGSQIQGRRKACNRRGHPPACNHSGPYWYHLTLGAHSWSLC